MREIVLDTETTGLNHKEGDRIIEVGGVELINHIASGTCLQFYCRVDKKIQPGAAKIHGITNEFLKNHPTFKEQSRKFLDFIKNDTLIIHNADFDIGFINNELKLINLEPIKNKIIDTVLLARKNLNTRVANLDYLCRRFSIDLTARKTHGALLDSQLLSEVYLELIGGKQRNLELTNVQKVHKTTNNTKNSLKKTKIKQISLKTEEINSHKNFARGIKNGIWQKMHY